MKSKKGERNKINRDSITIVPFEKLASTKAWKKTSEFVRKQAILPFVHGPEEPYVECYTCGSVIPYKESNAGHAMEKIGHAAIYFDRCGIKCQCFRCNRKLHGNYGVFTYKLIKEIGQKEYESYLKKSLKTKVWTKADLSKIVKETEKIKQ